jgi:carboxypeptidase Taq
MEEVFSATCRHARETAVLASVESLLGWDERTMMPAAGGDHRAVQASALAAVVHRHRTDPAQGERLSRLVESDLAANGPPAVRGTIRLLKRDFDKQARLPGRLVEEIAGTCVAAQQAWAAARSESSWEILRPWLQKVFALKREQGECQLPGRDAYDALMDDYEPEARWRSIAERFDRLRGLLVPLVRECVGARRRPSAAVMQRCFPVEAQRHFVRQVAARIGFDFQRGRLDSTDHPFCSTMGPDDCRITTRWDERFLPTALFGVLHEAGHGLYEQGLDRQWYGLPPGEAASLGIHESQSRLWENMVGRSSAFWEWCFPLARDAFPAALADSSAEEVQRALMVVEPSLIRVEADEVTYNLHVMMRFDLERAVVSGALPVDDLPAAWNDRFEADFGIRPGTDAEGVLQDIHWSGGLVGYFPTYTLGNLFAAQLMDAAERAIPELERQLAAGLFGDLLAWLRREVHSHGRLLESEPLVERATGSQASERWLVDSLRRRYLPAHGLA